MKSLFIACLAGLVYSGTPISEMYRLGKYEDVISAVGQRASAEDLTFKLYSYYKLSNYTAVSAMGKNLIVLNQSDSLKSVLAISSYYLSNNEDFTFYSTLIKSEKYQNEISKVVEHYDLNDFVKGSVYKNIDSKGFCFDDAGNLIIANENKLVVNEKVAFISEGKYVAYPFVKGNKIVFCSNLKKGEDLNESDLAKIGRDRISKLQLFVGEYHNGEVENIQLLPFNNLEYDFIAPYIDDAGNIYFSSNMAGGYGGFDLYRYEADSKLVKNLGEQFNSSGNEVGYSEFKNKVYFSSDKAGLGKLDIWSCMRNSKMYGNFINMGLGVNSKFSDFNFLVNAKKGYYVSMDANGVGSIRVVENINPRTESNVTFKNKFNDSSVVVKYYSTDYGSGIVYSDTINSNHAALFVDKQYSSNYDFVAYGFEKEVLNGSSVIDKDKGDILLTPKFYGIIEDFITGEPLEGVEISAVRGNDTVNATTDAKGEWFLPIEENDGWSISFGKKGYKIKSFTGKELNISALRNVSMGIDNKKGNKLEIRNIYFAFGKAEITKESIEVLDRIYNYMIENPEIKFEISAHTDSRGSDAANMKLSVNRALSAYKYLASKGISASRMSYKGYGETSPVNECGNGSSCSEEEYQMNRRVEIKIL